MFNLEAQKKRFSKHIATFSDLGKIKILDFAEPGHSEYRIRFIFEEEYYRLHISGDLGELIACNYNNMCFKKFGEDFVGDPGYFKAKVLCHSRDLEFFDEDIARNSLREASFFSQCEKEEVDDAIDCIMEYFDEYTGLMNHIELLTPYTDDSYEAYSLASTLGKTSTGILELYLLAFELATAQLNANNKPI